MRWRTLEATFVFIDLAGFTALTEAHGDEAAANLVERFVDIASQTLGDEARMVSVIGDAIFLVSPNPLAAIRVVGRLVELVEQEREFPEIRGGLHHGFAAERGPQFYGHAVNVAARIAGHAGGGKILCSDTLVASAHEMKIPVHPLGHVLLKNVREPIELYSLGFSSTELSDPIDPVCRMRVSPERAGAHLTVEGTDLWFCSRDCLRLYLRDMA